MKNLYSSVAVLDLCFLSTFQAYFKNNLRLHGEKKEQKNKKQAGAELGQAQPKLGFWENDLGLRNYIWGWGWMARGLK